MIEHAVNSLRPRLDVVREIVDGHDRLAPCVLRDRQLARHLEIIRSSFTVLLSGYLEDFLKEVARLAVRELGQRRIRFQDLPDRVRRAHFRHGAEVLNSRAKESPSPTWTQATPYDLATRLASATGPNCVLVWEAFADTGANPRFGVVKAFLKRFGVDELDQTLGQQLRRPVAATKLLLDELVDLRNECAHTGGLDNVPSPSKVRDQCDIVEEVAVAVTQILRNRFSSPPYGVDINRCSGARLETVPGLGTARAAAILNYRGAHGRFATLNDVLQVPGIGQSVLDMISPYVSV